MSRSYKEEFKKWSSWRSHILAKIEGCPLKEGDKVTYVNSYGVVFPHREVMGIQDPELTRQQFPTCKGFKIYLDYDCYWFPCDLSQLTKE